MGKYFPASNYKNKVIEAILQDDKIVRAVYDTESNFLSPSKNNDINPSTLVNTNIFPYRHVPDIQSESKTFITISVEFNWDFQNKKKFRLTNLKVFVFTHQNLQKTNYDFIRTDFLADRIEGIFQELKVLGIGTVFNSSYEEYQIAESKYNGSVLEYEFLSLTESGFYD